MSVTIRQAVAGDEPQLAALNAVVHELHVARQPAFFKAPLADEVAGWFRAQLVRTGVWAWLAERDGTAIGYALVVEHQRPDNLFCHARRWLEIDQAAVRPEERRHGVLRGLVERVREQAHALGIDEIELSCWSFNEDAQQAFRRLGFQPRTVRLGYGSDV